MLIEAYLGWKYVPTLSRHGARRSYISLKHVSGVQVVDKLLRLANEEIWRRMLHTSPYGTASY